jgi:uncharacterized cofD-like protein
MRPSAPAPGHVPVVALGGGHGLSASLSALRRVTTQLTAVVTVADNGGSSGRLRREFACLPPGDLRMALAALCGDDEWGLLWSEVAQHRFASPGPLDGHAMGNLLIVSLWQILGDPVEGLDYVGRLLGAHGRVLPMSADPLDIGATVRQADGSTRDFLGQVEVATAPGQVESIWLIPASPRPCPQALEAVAAAEVVVLGPGSWFTSVLPHLLVPDLRLALERTEARRVVVLNLAPQPGETSGFTPEHHLEVLAAHAPDLRLDVVIADVSQVADPGPLEAAAAKLGAEVVLARVAMADGSPRHDPVLLAAAYERVLGRDRIPPWR